MAGAAPRRKKVAVKRERPRFARPSEEMRRIAVMLGEELATFPDVTTRPMFGMVAYYRDGVVFAALPRTKTLGSPNSIIFKLNAAPERVFSRARKDARMQVSVKGIAGWQRLEISEEHDIAHAQRWLIEAWRYALKVSSKNRG